MKVNNAEPNLRFSNEGKEPADGLALSELSP
jgi:hypothetical protein